MPTTPSLLDPKLLQLLPFGPHAAKMAVPVQSAAKDFRRALAAIPPVNASGPEPVAAQAVQALLPQLSALPGQAVADDSQRILSVSETTIGTKRSKKAPEQTPATAASPTAAPQLSAARSITAASVFSAELPALAPAFPAAGAPDSSVAAPPPGMSAAAMPVKPEPVTATNDAKQTPQATPEKPAVMPTISTHLPPNGFAPAVVSPVQASRSPAKTAGITRQIAAALPRITLTNPGNPPALHISLTPATLGTITIKVAQHASGATTVTLTTSQPETLAALKRDAQHLDQVLTNAGIPEANRQVNFQTMPVAATQTSPGLGNAGGQPAGGQPAGGQSPGGQPPGGLPAGGLLAGGQQLGQGNGNPQQQQPGTAFASSVVKPVAAPAAESVARPRSNHAGRGVDVIA